MSVKSNLLKAAGIGAVVTALSAGAALAATVTTSLNVRTGPGTSFGVVDVLSPGSRVAVMDQQGGWCDIGNGWVSCRYLTDSRVNVGRSPVFDDPFYDPRFDRGPNVSFSFGFGPPRRHMRPWWW